MKKYTIQASHLASENKIAISDWTETISQVEARDTKHAIEKYKANKGEHFTPYIILDVYIA